MAVWTAVYRSLPDRTDRVICLYANAAGTAVMAPKPTTVDRKQNHAQPGCGPPPTPSQYNDNASAASNMLTKAVQKYANGSGGKALNSSLPLSI